MKRQGLAIIIIFLIMLFSFPLAHADTNLPAGKKPLEVKIGLFLNDILSLDEATETMHYNATLVMQWKDPSLAFNKLITGTHVKRYNTHGSMRLLSTIWHPQINLIGASTIRKTRKMDLDITDSGVVTWTEAFEAISNITMNLHRFPFDHQTLSISFQPFVENAEDVQLKLFPEYTGISPQNHLQGWEVHGAFAQVRNVMNHLYNKPFSQYTLYVQYKRISTYYIYQLLLPIILIVFLSFSVFWMINNPVVNRVAISLTSVLTIVVFQWRVQSKLPHVNYHTFSDVFMSVSFVLAASTVVASLIIHHISNEKYRMRFVTGCRVLYPIVYFALIGLVVFLFL